MLSLLIRDGRMRKSLFLFTTMPKFHPIFWRVPRIKRQKSSYACAWRSRGFYVLTQTVAPGPQPVTVSTSQPTSRYGSSVIPQAPLAIARSGVAFLSPDGTGRYSDVFWKRTQSLHASSNVDLGGILGSVIAHEMGHLLLGSNAHAISGIMRPHWESGELHRIARPRTDATLSQHDFVRIKAHCLDVFQREVRKG